MPIRFTIAAIFASAIFAQPPAERVLRFTHDESDRVLHETATDLRGITEMPEVSVDTAERTVTLHGTPAQIELADWLVRQWEKAAPAPHEYHMPSGDIVRVFYATRAPTPQVLQALATMLRTIANTHRIFTYDPANVITVRGDASQIALAEWLVNRLDQPAKDGADEFRPSGAADDVVRIFYPAHVVMPIGLQEIGTDVRAVADIRQAFTYNASTALVVRGTAVQIALAEWLVNQLDQPANGAAHEYRPSGGADDVVRVFHTAHTSTPRELQEIATDVRTIAEIRRLFTYNGSNALVLRGNASQMALSEWLVKQLDQPANQPPQAPAPHEFRPSGAEDDIVRVFFLTHAASLERLQEIATDIRSATEVKRLFTYSAPRALAARGTAAQIELAGRLIGEQDR